MSCVLDIKKHNRVYFQSYEQQLKEIIKKYSQQSEWLPSLVATFIRNSKIRKIREK